MVRQPAWRCMPLVRRAATRPFALQHYGGNEVGPRTSAGGSSRARSCGTCLAGVYGINIWRRNRHLRRGCSVAQKLTQCSMKKSTAESNSTPGHFALARVRFCSWQHEMHQPPLAPLSQQTRLARGVKVGRREEVDARGKRGDAGLRAGRDRGGEAEFDRDSFLVQGLIVSKPSLSCCVVPK